VPSYEAVHTDLFFYEHCSHFTPQTLAYLSSLSGFSIYKNLDGFLSPIEIGFLARNAEEIIDGPLNNAMSWIDTILEDMQKMRDGANIGVFGVGGAGLFIGPILGKSINFFVDDDPLKQGKLSMGIKILAVKEIESGAIVYVPFNNRIAAQTIQKRLSEVRPDVKFVLPGEI
jgi:hypothetical protein